MIQSRTWVRKKDDGNDEGKSSDAAQAEG
jgi:hypothetical protein